MGNICGKRQTRLGNWNGLKLISLNSETQYRVFTCNQFLPKSQRVGEVCSVFSPLWGKGDVCGRKGCIVSLGPFFTTTREETMEVAGSPVLGQGVESWCRQRVEIWDCCRQSKCGRAWGCWCSIEMCTLKLSALLYCHLTCSVSVRALVCWSSGGVWMQSDAFHWRDECAEWRFHLNLYEMLITQRAGCIVFIQTAELS